MRVLAVQKPKKVYGLCSALIGHRDFRLEHLRLVDDGWWGRRGEVQLQEVLMPVNWTNDFSVHVTTIDDDHRDLIEIINDLDAAVAEGCHAVFIGRFLGRLADYAARHFLREEQIMRDYGYPDYVDHVLAHEQLIYRLGELIFEFETGAKGVTAHTIDLLRDWFCGHICVDDREFGRYLRDHLDANPRSLADGLARSPSSAVAA